VPAEHAFGLRASRTSIWCSIGIPAVTAHRALTVAEDGPTAERGASLEHDGLGRRGAGAVGNAAIQLARWAARV
jgi:NADPH2:quinone reductase